MDQIPDCPICKTPTRPLYRDLEDGLYGVPGRYHFSRCPSCRLIRLDNRPDRENLFSLYENYYTREAAAETPEKCPQRRFGRFRDGLRRAILCGRFGYRDGHGCHALCRLGPLMSMVPGLRRGAVYDGLREAFPTFPNRTDNLLIDVGWAGGTSWPA